MLIFLYQFFPLFLTALSILNALPTIKERYLNGEEQFRRKKINNQCTKFIQKSKEFRATTFTRDNFISYKCTKYNIFFLNFGYTNILFVDYTFLRWFGPPMKFLSLDLASSYQKLLIQVHGCNSIP